MDHHNSLGVEHFTVGWICGLPVELTAAAELLDEEYPPLRIADDNLYTFGRIGDHNVVIACLPTGQNGASSAATVTQIKDKFPSIRFGLIVGTGSGVPSTEHDIRLGDIVVSQPVQGYGGVVQYEYNTLAGRELHRYESLKAPPPVLLQALSKIQANHMRGTIRFKDYLRVAERLHVGHCDDILFKATYSHAGGPTCEDCSEKELESRTIRRNKDVIVHYGTIASSNQIIRDALTRDGLASRLGGVLCFDTDAAGLMNDFPCIVVRGICDYADSHRYGTWQAYAAATAAAYAKELLGVIPAKSEGTTYRVSRIPDTYSADSFHDALRISLHLKPHTTLIIHSFASDWLQRRTATITFSDTPSKLYSAGADNAGGKTTEWRVNIVHPLSIQSDTVCIDRHFTGFTPVSPLDNDVEHLVEYVA
jgi:nucleoside phosphorylase